MASTRREFVKQSSLTLAFSVAGLEMLLTPAQAYAKGASFKVLSKEEVAILEAFAEELLPGSVESGVTHFIDDQLSRDPNESLLIARYFQIEPPYAGFYKGGLAVLNGYCLQNFGRPFIEMEKEARKKFVGSLFKMGPNGPVNPDGWMGPPATILYLCVRSDAVDVTYGTEEGFEKLKVPYMAHITPPAKW